MAKGYIIVSKEVTVVLKNFQQNFNLIEQSYSFPDSFDSERDQDLY